MRKLLALLAVIGMLAVASPAQAATYSATMTFVSRDASYLVVHVEQTGGDLVRLEVSNANHVYDAEGRLISEAGVETKYVTGSADVVFYVGPRKFKGQTLTPNAWGIIVTYHGSQSLASLYIDAW